MSFQINGCKDGQRMIKWEEQWKRIQWELIDCKFYDLAFWEFNNDVLAQASSTVNKQSIFYALIYWGYVHGIALTVRRQVEIDKSRAQSVSLCGMLHEIKECCNASLKTTIDADLEKLSKISELVVDYVDRNLAHSDKRPSKQVADTACRSCLEELWSIFKKYHMEFHPGEVFSDPKLPSGWKNIFREPWIAK